MVKKGDKTVSEAAKILALMLLLGMSLISCTTQSYLDANGESFEHSTFGGKTDHFTEKKEIGREVISENIVEKDKFEQRVSNQSEIDVAKQQQASEQRAQNEWHQASRNYRDSFDSRWADNPQGGMAARTRDQQYQYYSDPRNAPHVTTTIPAPRYVQVKVGIVRTRITRYRIQYNITTYYVESTGQLPTSEITFEEKEDAKIIS